MSPAQVVKEWWGEPWKRRFALLTATLIAFTTFLHFAEVAEPYWIAHKQFVRDQVAELKLEFGAAQQGMSAQLIELKISNREDARASAKAQIDRIEAELAKLAAGTNDTLRQILSEQLARYKRRVEIIDFELDRMRRERSGRRP